MYLRRIICLEELGQTFVVRLAYKERYKTHYPSRPTKFLVLLCLSISMYRNKINVTKFFMLMISPKDIGETQVRPF